MLSVQLVLPHGHSFYVHNCFQETNQTVLRKNSYFMFVTVFLKEEWALAGVAQWTEYRPENQKVTGSIPSQDPCLGCRPGLQLVACENQLFFSHTTMFLSLSVSFPLSKSK